jgi:hypothetical protein
LIFVSAQIDTDEKDELQKEAEEMNELGIRKLPRDDDGPDPDKVIYLDQLEPVIWIRIRMDPHQFERYR